EPRVQLAILEFGEHGAQRRDVLIAGLLGDQARRHAFERRPGGDHLDHLALGLAHYIDTAPRHRAHKALALELRHRLTHRGAADAEGWGRGACAEPPPRARPKDARREDDPLERRVAPALEAGRACHRLTLHRRVCAGLLQFIHLLEAGAAGTVTGTHWDTLSAAWYAIFQRRAICNV